MHPSPARLMALEDGQLTPVAAERVRLHVRGCRTCQEECRRFAAERQLLLARRRAGPELDATEAWERLQAAIEELRTAGQENAGLRAAARRRLLDALACYFGPATAARFETASDRRLLAHTEMLLTTFLGRESAQAALKNVPRRSAGGHRRVEVRDVHGT